MLHHRVLILRVHLCEPVHGNQEIRLLGVGLRSVGPQFVHTPDVGQANSPCDFDRNRQRIARQHLHADAKIGNELGSTGRRQRTTASFFDAL